MALILKTNSQLEQIGKIAFIVLTYMLSGIGALPTYASAGKPQPVAKEITGNIRSDTISLFTISKKPHSLYGKELDNIAPGNLLLELDAMMLVKVLNENCEHIVIEIPLPDNQSMHVALDRVNLFSDNFSAVEIGSNKTEKTVSYQTGIHYRGKVQGNEGSLAAISLFSNNVMGIIALQNGNYVLGKLANKANTYVLYNDAQLNIKNLFECGVNDDSLAIYNQLTPNNENGNWPGNLLLSEAQPDCDKVVKIYFHCDYDMFTDFSNSSANVINYTTGLFNVMAAIYANESITTQISQIYVWTVPDPYPDSSSSSSLNAFGAQVGNSFNGDLAHLLSTNNNGLGGVAWLNKLCANSNRHAYSNIATTYQNLPLYSWSVEVITHEIGHNLGSPHTQACSWPGGAIDNCYTVEGSCMPGPAPVNGGTIMSYCHLTSYGINFANGFGTLPGNLIRNKVESASCLTSGFATITVTGSTTICSGSSVQLTASPSGTGYTYQWKLNGTNISGATSISYNATAGGNYTVAVTNAAGCVSVSAPVTISVTGGTPIPQFTYAVTGLSVTFTNTSGNSNAYSWNFGDPATGSSNTSTLTNPSHTFSAAGTYTVSLTAYNNCAVPPLQQTTTQTITLQSYSPCSGNSTYTGCTGTVTDGSGTQNYNNNQSCSWLIAPTGASNVTLTFSAFNTEAGYDFVRVYNGPNASYPLLGSYAGASLPASVNSGPNMYITFTTDESITGAGFTANYTCTIGATCSGTTTLNTCSGTLSDGSGSNNYSNNLNCSWLINPGGATAITLTFSSFNTEAGFDFVKVYNGSNSSAPLLGSYSGTTLPAAVTANSGTMFIKFTTDVSVTLSGWSASYSCTLPDFCSGANTLTACSGSFSDGSGTQNYLNNQSCSWLLSPAGAASVTLTFTDFSTQSGSDLLRIYNGSNSSASSLGTYSGNTLPPVITSSGPTMYITFASNSSVTAAGFTANYTCNTINPCNGVNATATASNTTCGLNNGSIFVASSGIASPAYTWFPAIAGNQQNPSGLAPGTYSVTVSGSGCTATAAATIGTSLPFTISLGSNSPVCAGKTITLNSSQGLYFSWSGPNGFISTQQNPVREGATIAMGGIYSATVTNNVGCTASATTAVSVQPLPTPQANSNNPCSGGLFTLNASGGAAYQWSGPNGFTSSLQNPTVSTGASAVMNGVYTVTVTGSNGCTANTSVQVSVNNSLQPNIFGNPFICDGATETLWVDNIYNNYTWNTGATTSSITIANSGLYSVAVSNASGCTGSASVVVSSLPNPVPNINSNSPVCAGNPISLSCSGGNYYTWNGPNGFSSNQQNPSITNATTAMNGIYSVTVTNYDLCSATASVNVSVQQPPIISIGSNNPCTGGVFSLSATGGGSYSWSGPNGFSAMQANPLVTNSASSLHNGTYTVTVTNATGCSASQSVNIVVTNVLFPQITGYTTICQGSSTVLHAGNGYTIYNWSTGANTASINASMQGIYSVTVTNSSGCTGSTSTIVTVNPVPVVNVSSNSPVCEEDNLNLSCSGGTNYLWSGPNSFASSVQNPQISNAGLLFSGTYLVTVSNSYNCNNTASVNISVIPKPDAGTDNSIAICNDSSEGIVTVNLNSLVTGTTGGTFSATGGAPLLIGGNTFMGNGLPAGANYFYNYTVSGAAPCESDDALFTVFVQDCAICANPPDASFAYSSGSYCVGTGMALPSLQPGATSGTWTSYPAGLTLNSLNGAINLNSSLPGTYLVTNTVPELGSCPEVSANYYVVINPQPIPSVWAQPSAICLGESAQLTGAPNFSYAWSNNQSGSPIVVNPITNTTYQVTVTNTWGCSTTTSVQVLVNEPPILVAGSSNPCIGSSLILYANGSGATSYTWSGPGGFYSTQQNPVVSAIATTALNGTYHVTAMGANGCSVSDSVTIAVNNILFPAINGENSICEGEISMLWVAPGYASYAWSSSESPEIISNSNTIYVSESATYSVTVSNAAGCSGFTSIPVLVNPAPVGAIAGNSPLCAGDDIVFSSSGGVSYNWAGPNGFVSDLQNPIISNSSPAMNGLYTVTITNAANCSTSKVILVEVINPPNAGADNSATVCNSSDEGNTIINVNSMLTGAAGGTFSPLNGAPPLTDNAIFDGNNLEAGNTYTYAYTVAGTPPCNNDQATLTIIVNDCLICATVPTATFGYSNTAYCKGSGFAAPLMAIGATSGIWSAMPGGLVINETNGIIDLNNSAPGEYVITNTVAASGACPQVSANNVVTINELPSANAGPDVSACAGVPVWLTASGGISYLWSTGQNAAAISVAPVTTSSYIVTVYNSLGCAATDTVTVNIFQNPVANAGSPQNICYGEGTVLTATGGIYFHWSTNENTSSIAVYPAETTVYWVTVTDSNGCTDSDNTTVTVLPLPEIYAGPDQSICTGSTTWLQASGGIEYEWNTGQTTSNIFVSPQINTNYVVWGTDNNNCTGVDTVSVTLLPLPVVNAGEDQYICAGQSVVLTASSNTSGNFLWSNDAGNEASVEVSPLVNTIYTVTFTDNNGCLGYDDVMVSITPPPFTINSPQATGNPAIICFSTGGYALSFTISGGTPPYFVDGVEVPVSGSFVSGQLFDPNYSLVITDNTGCIYILEGTASICSSSCNVTAAINPLYDTGNCTDGFSVQIVQGPPPTNNYQYSVDGVNFQPSPTFTNLNAGLYQVYVNIGCTIWNIGSFEMPFNTLQVTGYVSPVESGGYLAITLVTGGTPFYTYEWSNGNTGSSAFLSNFTNPVTVTVTDKNDCQQYFVFAPGIVGTEDQPELQATELIKLYPNPTKTGLVMLEIPRQWLFEPVEVEVYDILGRLLMFNQLPPANNIEPVSINLSLYSNGVYFIDVVTPKQRTVAKTIIAR
ncbi:PKD domain-containing protein [Sphingobacteriales bacterium UPWRP_1]|nr:hypothetical protein BVG80_07595 [Sphingobacteriales bacterium TSM_CSM]PSJ76110.1 PKD domain-containing protein [Sphingobacteriales bacterium UPWRP_1]